MMMKHIQTLVKAALAEDVGSGDLTAKLIPKAASAHAQLICRDDAILCGRPWFEAVFAAVDDSVELIWRAIEGDNIEPGQALCELRGNARSILTAERTAINLLQSLSGTATTARQYVDRLEGLNTRVLDTRKTIPGMRLSQKYACKIGGAMNHRIGLFDGVLIKENHIRAAGSIAKAMHQALQNTAPGTLLEVEVENLNELGEALEAGARRILLDNFSLEQLCEAVAIRPEQVEFEASGDVSLETIREIAQTGVDFISVGALTKHLHAIDYSLQFTLDL